MCDKRIDCEVKGEVDVRCSDSGVGGATMVEYAILVALMAVVCIASITFLGKTLSVTFSGIASMLQ